MFNKKIIMFVMIIMVLIVGISTFSATSVSNNTGILTSDSTVNSNTTSSTDDNSNIQTVNQVTTKNQVSDEIKISKQDKTIKSDNKTKKDVKISTSSSLNCNTGDIVEIPVTFSKKVTDGILTVSYGSSIDSIANISKGEKLTFNTTEYLNGQYPLEIEYCNSTIYNDAKTTTKLNIYQPTSITANKKNITFNMGKNETNNITFTLGLDSLGDVINGEINVYMNKTWINTILVDDENIITFTLNDENTQELKPGAYTLYAEYLVSSGDYYINSNTTLNAKLKGNVVLNVTNPIMALPNTNTTIPVNVMSNVVVKTGNLTCKIDGKTLDTIDLSKQKSVFVVDTSKLTIGSHNVTLYYKSNTYTNATNKTILKVINASKFKTTIICKNVTKTLGSKITLNATVKDIYGNMVNTGKAVVKINGKTFGNTTVKNGIMKFVVNLTPEIFGKYNYKVTFIYGENSKYYSSTKNSVLTITGFKPVIKVKATNNTCIGDSIKITANITNGSNYGANSGTVGLKINGITYKINGKAVIVKPVNGIATFKINATSKMIRNNNITITYSGNSQFYEGRTTVVNAFKVQNKTRVICTVNPANGTLGQNVILSAKFTTFDGKVLNGQKVVVKINGKTFGYTTVKNGIAKFTQYLDSTLFGGYNYKITFTIGESNTYSSATNKNILTVTKYTSKFTYKKITTTVQKTAKITVKITNKNNTFTPNSGTVGLKINGITYKVNKTAVTVKPVNGIATFNITITNKMIGNNNITFTYSGNSQFYEGRTTITNGLIVKT